MNRQIDKEEFKKVMALMRTYNRQGAHHRDGLRIGLNVTGSVENGGLLEYFFGKDGNECLEHEKFVQFLRDLHDEVSWSLSLSLSNFFEVTIVCVMISSNQETLCFLVVVFCAFWLFMHNKSICIAFHYGSFSVCITSASQGVFYSAILWV